MTTVDAELAAAWEPLVGLFMTARDRHFDAMRQLGLTPPHGLALMSLATPRRMSELAETMSCDASYITAIVDRLEELGLAERRASTTDRRVKEVALTRKGHRAVEKLHSLINRPPDALMQLSATDRKALIRILGKLAPLIPAATDAGCVPPAPAQAG